MRNLFKNIILTQISCPIIVCNKMVYNIIMHGSHYSDCIIMLSVYYTAAGQG